MSSSVDQAPFLTLCHNFGAVYPPSAPQCSNPFTLGPMTSSEWNMQLHQLQLGCQWRRHSVLRYTDSSGPAVKRASLAKGWEWHERWDCDHKGIKRKRASPDVPPEKKQKAGLSIKVGCKAGFSVGKLKGMDIVYVKWYWQHTGHNPMDLSTIRESRLLGTVMLEL